MSNLDHCNGHGGYAFTRDCIVCNPPDSPQPPALSDAEIDVLFEHSKNDNEIIVGSDVRVLCAQAKRANALAAEVERLRDDLKRAQNSDEHNFDRWQDASRRADAAVAALAALETYGRHQWDCEIERHKPFICTCGYDEALKECVK